MNRNTNESMKQQQTTCISWLNSCFNTLKVYQSQRLSELPTHYRAKTAIHQANFNRFSINLPATQFDQFKNRLEHVMPPTRYKFNHFRLMHVSDLNIALDWIMLPVFDLTRLCSCKLYRKVKLHQSFAKLFILMPSLFLYYFSLIHFLTNNTLRQLIDKYLWDSAGYFVIKRVTASSFIISWNIISSRAVIWFKLHCWQYEILFQLKKVKGSIDKRFDMNF